MIIVSFLCLAQDIFLNISVACAERVEAFYWPHRYICWKLEDFRWRVRSSFLTCSLAYNVLQSLMVILLLSDSSAVGSGGSKSLSPRKNLEEEYLDYEAKVEKHYYMLSLHFFVAVWYPESYAKDVKGFLTINNTDQTKPDYNHHALVPNKLELALWISTSSF